MPFHYGADGRSAARLSPDMTPVGNRSIDAERYRVDWGDGPKDSCTRLLETASAIALVDATSGETRGTVERVVPGNPEGL